MSAPTAPAEPVDDDPFAWRPRADESAHVGPGPVAVEVLRVAGHAARVVALLVATGGSLLGLAALVLVQPLGPAVALAAAAGVGINLSVAVWVLGVEVTAWLPARVRTRRGAHVR